MPKATKSLTMSWPCATQVSFVLKINFACNLCADQVNVEYFYDEECTELIPDSDIWFDQGCTTENVEEYHLTAFNIYCTEGSELPVSDFLDYSVLL